MYPLNRDVSAVFFLEWLNMEPMSAMFAEAREKGLWFHCAYQDLWFSPDELQHEQENGKFRWGSSNWRLRDPAERVAVLEREIEDRQQQLNRFAERIAASTAK